MARVEVITIPKPPYSPDLIPPNFFLFPKVINLKKMSFRDHWQHQNDFDEAFKSHPRWGFSNLGGDTKSLKHAGENILAREGHTLKILSHITYLINRH